MDSAVCRNISIMPSLVYVYSSLAAVGLSVRLSARRRSRGMISIYKIHLEVCLYQALCPLFESISNGGRKLGCGGGGAL